MRFFTSFTAAVLLFLSCSSFAAVNLNTASSAELQSVKGIGPVRAARIIAYRKQHGPFSSLSDLTAVPGIGPALLNRIRNRISVSSGGTSSAQPHPGQHAVNNTQKSAESAAENSSPSQHKSHNKSYGKSLNKSDTETKLNQ